MDRDASDNNENTNSTSSNIVSHSALPELQATIDSLNVQVQNAEQDTNSKIFNLLDGLTRLKQFAIEQQDTELEESITTVLTRVQSIMQGESTTSAGSILDSKIQNVVEDAGVGTEDLADEMSSHELSFDEVQEPKELPAETIASCNEPVASQLNKQEPKKANVKKLQSNKSNDTTNTPSTIAYSDILANHAAVYTYLSKLFNDFTAFIAVSTVLRAGSTTEDTKILLAEALHQVTQLDSIMNHFTRSDGTVDYTSFTLFLQHALEPNTDAVIVPYSTVSTIEAKNRALLQQVSAAVKRREKKPIAPKAPMPTQTMQLVIPVTSDGVEEKAESHNEPTAIFTAESATATVPATHEVDTISEQVEPTSASHHYDAFLVLKELGAGGFGKVFEVMNNGKHYALKVSKGDAMTNQEVKRLEREARLLASVSDIEKVIGLHSAGTTKKGNFFYLLELIDGIELKSAIAHSEINQLHHIQYTAVTFYNIALAMMQLHARRIAHRDIKPDNIMIQKKDGSPKIADLGMGIEAGTHSVSMVNQRGGTLNYMSPENFTKNDIDQDQERTAYLADVYGLGLTMYAAVTGQSLYDFKDNKTAHQTLTQVAYKGHTQNLSKVRFARLSKIIAEMIHHKDEERICMIEVVQRLQNLIQESQLFTEEQKQEYKALFAKQEPKLQDALRLQQTIYGYGEQIDKVKRAQWPLAVQKEDLLQPFMQKGELAKELPAKVQSAVDELTQQISKHEAEIARITTEMLPIYAELQEVVDNCEAVPLDATLRHYGTSLVEIGQFSDQRFKKSTHEIADKEYAVAKELTDSLVKRLEQNEAIGRSVQARIMAAINANRALYVKIASATVLGVASLFGAGITAATRANRMNTATAAIDTLGKRMSEPQMVDPALIEAAEQEVNTAMSNLFLVSDEQKLDLLNQIEQQDVLDEYIVHTDANSITAIEARVDIQTTVLKDTATAALAVLSDGTAQSIDELTASTQFTQLQQAITDVLQLDYAPPTQAVEAIVHSCIPTAVQGEYTCALHGSTLAIEHTAETQALAELKGQFNEINTTLATVDGPHVEAVKNLVEQLNVQIQMWPYRAAPREAVVPQGLASLPEYITVEYTNDNIQLMNKVELDEEGNKIIHWRFGKVNMNDNKLITTFKIDNYNLDLEKYGYLSSAEGNAIDFNLYWQKEMLIFKENLFPSSKIIEGPKYKIYSLYLQSINKTLLFATGMSGFLIVDNNINTINRRQTLDDLTLLDLELLQKVGKIDLSTWDSSNSKVKTEIYQTDIKNLVKFAGSGVLYDGVSVTESSNMTEQLIEKLKLSTQSPEQSQ